MFKNIYAKMCNNKIFDVYNIEPVPEDYFLVDDNIFCIADGVTRDTIEGKAVPYPKTKEEVVEWKKMYPNPSGAYESAKICGDNFVKYAKKMKKINEEEILKVVKKVNSDILEINKDRKIDYLAEDLYGCVAVGGYITGNELYCFSIGDSHIIALNENLEIKYSTINNHEPFETYLDQIYTKQNKFDWYEGKDRAMVRRDFRNKPHTLYNGKDISFGVLTGEKEAEYYIVTYKWNLEDIKYICAYSDGCEPFFKTKENIQKIIENPSIIEKEGKERTLVIYKKI